MVLVVVVVVVVTKLGKVIEVWVGGRQLGRKVGG